jgi:lactoylglutathione lyase
MFNDVFPILVTPDMPRALGFYRDLLGRAPEAATGAGGQRFSLWVYADSCDEAIERLRGGGATVTEEPADQPWGERIARVLDPDGNEVIVGQKA